MDIQRVGLDIAKNLFQVQDEPLPTAWRESTRENDDKEAAKKG